jgi:hypothetical protein
VCLRQPRWREDLLPVLQEQVHSGNDSAQVNSYFTICTTLSVRG